MISVSMSHSRIFWNIELILTMGRKPGWFCKNIGNIRLRIFPSIDLFLTSISLIIPGCFMEIPKAILDIETHARNYSLVFSCVCFASKTKLEKVCTNGNNMAFRVSYSSTFKIGKTLQRVVKVQMRLCMNSA